MFDPFRTSFVGRESELGALGRVLAGGRLVTLVGPPGIGKSRLAFRFLAASGHAATHFDLGSPLGSMVPEQLRSALAADGVVLVDDYDSRAGSPDVAEWLAEASATCLVTSRGPLRLAGEVVVEVGPLGLPSESVRTLAELVETESGRLLSERAAIASRLTDADAPIVAEIVRRVGGNPLAIELAAGRCRVLGPRHLLDRLERELDVLGGGAAGTRHVSVRAAIDASFTTLETDEQDALVQCSVFRSSFPLAAAEDVVRLAGRAKLIDVLERLVDAGLLRSELTSAPAEVRLTMDANVRRYAAELLAQRDDRDAVASRSVAYYERWSRVVVTRPVRSGGPGVLETIGVDAENMVGALEAALESGTLSRQPLGIVRDGAIRLGLPMSGRPKVGSFALLESCAQDLASEEVECGGPGLLRAAVLRLAGVALGSLGRLARARSYLERALEAAGDVADGALRGKWRGRIACALGALATVNEAWDESHGWFTEARSALPPSDAIGLVEVACHRGNALLHAGRPGDALLFFDEALAAAKANDRSLALVLFNRAVALQDAAELDEARRSLEHAVTLHHGRGDAFARAGAVAQLGALHHEAGRAAEAEAAYRDALDGLRGARVPRAEGSLLAWLGCLLATQDREREAGAIFADARARVEQAGDRGAAITWRLARAALDLHRARALRVAADEGAARARDTARARIDGAAEYVDARERAPRTFASVDHDDDHRFLRRILARELDRDVLVVADDGSCMRLPSGELVEVAQRRIARLLQLLAAHRSSSLAEPLAFDALCEGLWPGERMTRASAQNRLQVCLSTLRSLGLRDVLLREGDGYLLDPRTPTTVRPAAEVRR